jgi:hypothetical protein
VALLEQRVLESCLPMLDVAVAVLETAAFLRLGQTAKYS